MTHPRTKITTIKPVCNTKGCPKFGKQHDKCRAHNRKGLPCGYWPMHGQWVCRLHGGKSINAEVVAVKRSALIEIGKMAEFLTRFDETNTETPAEGLMREVAWSGQIAQALGAACEKESDAQLVNYGIGAAMSPIFQAWERERITHAKLCKLALDAGIEQRQLDLLESQAGQIVSAILAVLGDKALGLSSEQIIEGRVIAAKVLRRQAAH
jgi:hypothetical protein